MSLINELREKRDSWLKRFEEHRRDDEDGEAPPMERDKENEMIERKRAMVGVSPKKRDYKKS